jgi:hypothetical protein
LFYFELFVKQINGTFQTAAIMLSRLEGFDKVGALVPHVVAIKASTFEPQIRWECINNSVRIERIQSG